MPDRPPALLPQTQLQDRYEILEVLGQGTFGIVYRAKDLKRGDVCIVRELAPAGAIRDEYGILFLSKLGASAAQRLRQRFIKEARELMRFSGAALPAIRGAFCELGTAYLVREFLPDALSLRERVEAQGPIPASQLAQLLEPIASSLDRLHRQGVYHLDLRPSNVLLTKGDRPHLVDFGGARKWHRDLFEPESDHFFGPPELSKRGSRVLPQSDIYGLAELARFALTGEAESSPNLFECLPEPLASALRTALEEDAHRRPKSIAIFAGVETEPERPAGPAAFEAKALALKSLRFDRRECPSCNGVLESPRPLRPEQCPVCHEGRIRIRRVEADLCPNCRMGFLKELANEEPPSICPLCAEGLLHRKRKSFMSKEFTWLCDSCEAEWKFDSPDFSVESSPSGESYDPLPAAAWRELSGRSHRIRICPACGAQYDLMRDERWRQVLPAAVGRYEALESEEWARVAAGLPPDAGNAECDNCGADFYVEGGRAALLETRFDPHQFAAHSAGRFATFEELTWLSVGKESPHPGLVCVDCETEFDSAGQGLLLVRTHNLGMAEHIGRTLSLEDWHRAGKELPIREEQAGFEEAFDAALRVAFASAEAAFSEKDESLIWKGPAVRLEEQDGNSIEAAEGQLLVDREEITFGGKLRKWRRPFLECTAAEGTDDSLTLHFSDGLSQAFRIAPTPWTAKLESGPRTVTLGPWDVMMRLRAELARRQEPAAA